MSSMRSACVLFFMFCALGLPGVSYGQAAATRTREELDADLAKARTELSTLQASLTKQSQALLQKQHDVEYADPDLTQLREELVKLEKQVVEKRKQLNERISIHPEISKLEKERRALFQSLENARANEAAIENEIKALENSAGAVQ